MPRTPFARLLILCLVVVFATLPVTAQKSERGKILADIQNVREQLRQKEAQFLEPTKEERAAFASFLAQPGTGMTRLLPRETFDDAGPSKRSPLTTRGGGSYYSFTNLTHEYGYGSDINFSRDEFSVGFAGADFGWLVALGDVPLEPLSIEHPALQYLDALVTPSSEPEARVAQRKTSGGVRHGEYAYWSRVPAAVGTTYGIRSINYGGSDVLVAFRVLSKDDDGSVVLLWKNLRTYPVPRLTREPATVE
jgi:hypothetical protein